MRVELHNPLKEYGLTLGTLGSTAGQTVMVVLLPVLLARYTESALMIGFAIGGEGLFALFVPYWIGALSDHLPPSLARRFGRRTFFLLVTAPVMALALAISPFIDGYWRLAAVAFVFFSAFHGYLTPLWTLMVDKVPPERLGRVHGVRGAVHAAGLGFGLVAGGVLFHFWPPLPFLIAALLILVTTYITIAAAPAGVRDGSLHGEPATEPARRIWADLVRERTLLWFLAANALWTGAVDGIRPYVFLFGVAVLGVNTAQTSLALSLLVVGTAIGSVILGHLGDRYGRGRLLEWGGILTGLIMLLGVLVRNLEGAVALLLASGIGAAAIIALPYPLFASLVGGRSMGRYTGLYIFSMGLARVVAPVLVGAAIQLGIPLFPEQRGYPMMWPVAGLFALLGVLALRRADTQIRDEKGPAEPTPPQFVIGA